MGLLKFQSVRAIFSYRFQNTLGYSQYMHVTPSGLTMNRQCPKRYLLLLGILVVGAIVSMNARAASSEFARHVSIAHGGASAYAPFNSMASFRLALSMDADYIETDLQLTKDGILVCIHDPSLENQTNVEATYPDRFTRITRNGEDTKTWYVNDFTLEEIKTLDFGSWYGPEFKDETIATFQELIDLAKGNVGLYPETKDLPFYAARGINLEKVLHDTLTRNGLLTKESQATTPIVVQSFYEESLKRLRELGGDSYTLIQLVWFGQWNDYMTDEGLTHVASYADGIGPFLSMVLPPNASRIYEAHQRGLLVHVWKAHEAFPPEAFPDRKAYMRYLLNDLDIDGIFTGHPDEFPEQD